MSPVSRVRRRNRDRCSNGLRRPKFINDDTMMNACSTISRREVSPVLVDSPLMRHAQISTAARSGPVSLSLCS